MCDDTCSPSSENIIKEITEDLQKQQIDVVQATEPQEHSTKDKLYTEAPEDFEKTDSEEDLQEKKETIPDDFVDEEKLKDVEATLTSEEKEARRKEALKLKNEGNDAHKQEKFLEAIKIYTEALHLCPLTNQNERSVLYSNRAASKLQLKYKATAIDDCSKAVELNPNYVRAYLRRAKLYEETEKLDESLEDYKKILELDRGNPEGLKASVRLPPLIAERNEKLKTEMLGKLKDLGNMVLKPFGLSTDNFQLQQNPDGGGYSVNFSQK